MAEAPQGSAYDRLFYPFLFEGGETSAELVLAEIHRSILDKRREIIRLRRAVLEQSGEQIAAVGQAMARAFRHGAALLAFGNGGSATDAQDVVTECIHPPWPDCPSLPAIALTNDSAVVTAVGNDVGFEHSFARQIIAFGRPGDIALGISTSGNSANILRAFEQAKKQGMLTTGLAGYDGGKTARSTAVDHCIIVPSDYIPRIQEAQATIYHALLAIVFTLLRAGSKAGNAGERYDWLIGEEQNR